jgi:hypothetical protein
MKKSITLLAFAILLVSTLGCAAILEGSVWAESAHVGSGAARPIGEFSAASNFDELKLVILEIVETFEDSGKILIYSYDGDLHEDVDRAIYEILHNHPIGAFAVYDIIGEVAEIITHFEVGISVEFNRSEHQIDSIIFIESTNQLEAYILSAMTAYEDELVIRTDLREITPASLERLIWETYYNNPRHIIMMPNLAISVFPESGTDRIFEIHFGHMQSAAILGRRTTTLIGAVVHNADAAVGENDTETVLALVETLIRASDFDEGAARAISEHGVQNPLATAFGALVNGNAVGEGFAMAFKALCDELGINNQVVLGELGGMIHAWNIVNLGGNYYHIDVAMAAVNGLETAFLKNDEAFLYLEYSWDTGAVPRADGVLTYYDVRSMLTPVYDEDENDE